jgi:hypothetical protein
MGVTSCDDFGRSDNPGPPAIEGISEFTQLSYGYTDSSIPTGHRSYDIKIIDTVVLLSIRDYDTVLLSKEFALSNEEQSKLKELVLPITSTEDMNHTGENGSDAESIVILNGSVEVMDIFWNQNETKEVRALVDFMKGLTGNIDELVQSTIKINDSLVVAE